MHDRGGGPPAGPTGDAIRAYDTEGREILIDREQYRRDILPDQFRGAVDRADDLYDAIVLALEDGFCEEALEPARRLHDIDPDHERSTVVLGIALMKTDRLEEAAALFEQYLARRGPSGTVLTNLAKVCALQGKRDLAEAVLWNALQADPNQANGLSWWGAMHFERGGAPAYLEAMKRAADLPESWRAQLWLARAQLEQGRLAPALSLYESVLPMAAEFGDAMMMISGDLGNHGHPQVALDLVGPRYEARKHGALAGLNLIAACVQVSEVRRGLRLCDEVENLGRYDLIEPLRELRRQLLAA